jgi:transcriptional regulator with XRE-family HTH domain
MGVKARQRPERLAEKLLHVRVALGQSQTGLLKLLGLEDAISYKKISDFERGEREPTLLIILEYARVAGVHVEDLINDKTDLPEKLPGRVRHVT